MTALVLLPGLDGTGRMFRDFVAALGSGIDPVVVSYPPDPFLGYAQLASIVRSSLPPDRPFHLLAESFSGPVGIAIASEQPLGLRGLILSCSFARSPLPVLSLFHSLIGRIPPSAIPRQALSYFTFGGHAPPARVDALVEAIESVPDRVLRDRSREAIRVDVSRELERVTVPVLYLRAKHDRIVTQQAAGIVARHAPQTRVVELDGPHLLLQALPLEAAAHVGAFIRHSIGTNAVDTS